MAADGGIPAPGPGGETNGERPVARAGVVARARVIHLHGVDPAPSARSPRVISAKFGRFRPDPGDRRAGFRAMVPHMKTLAAPDAPVAFDFFAVTAGPQRLAARRRDRRNSPGARMPKR